MAGVALLAALLVLTGCNSTDQTQDVPLPDLAGGDARRLPEGVYAVIRQATIPLDQPTDDAWAATDETVVPLLMRGAWRGNGLRLGVVGRDRFEAYTDAMPAPVALSETLINRSAHPIPVLETPRLSSDLLFEIDLTRPPMPRHAEDIVGGKNSTLRLLARIETEEDGRHTLVLTPHHHIPSPYDLIPRSPLEKELDGRVFSELTVRLTLDPDQVAVVGLHWPWPVQEVFPEASGRLDNKAVGDRREENRASPQFVHAADDPAAPPPHIVGPRPADLPNNPAGDEDAEANDKDNDDEDDPAPRTQRVAPPLPTHFGSTLFTGTRIRQPVRHVLLISIVEPKSAEKDETAE